MTSAASDFLRQLTLLRWFAAAGQALAVLFATRVLDMALDARWLWLGIAALVAFNLAVRLWWRRRPATVAQAMGVLSFDIAQLAWMIAWSGGAMNPFTSLFLLPVALVAVSFRPSLVLLTALMSGTGYAIATISAGRAPLDHHALMQAIDLHLWGMAVNFLVSCGVFALFLARLSAAVRERDTELARFRERFARDEGILALATHAASVAHELNTPLGTLTLLVEEQLAQLDPGDPARRQEIEEMAQMVNACRDRVRALSAPADGAPEADALAVLNGSIDRWQLLRPAVELQRHDDLAQASHARLDPAVGHLLQVLLNNAADASEAAGSHVVSLTLTATARHVVGRVRDFGHGIATERSGGSPPLFASTKPDGLGIGLALSHATLERLGGHLSMRKHAQGGTEVEFDVPLNAGATP